jgi:predicted transcriptional regulator
MNLFKLNAQLSVKLNQSLDTLYNLEYLEYSLLLNIINEEIEERNEKIKDLSNEIERKKGSPLKVNLPSHLKLK